MPNEIASVQAEDIRLKNLRSQLENRNRSEIKEIQDRHEHDLYRLTTGEAETLENLKSAYDVQISKEAENLEARLAEVRQNNEERVLAEKKQGDAEVEKIKFQTQQKIDEYKKIGETQLERQRKEYASESSNLHEREKMLEKQKQLLAHKQSTQGVRA